MTAAAKAPAKKRAQTKKPAAQPKSQETPQESNGAEPSTNGTAVRKPEEFQPVNGKAVEVGPPKGMYPEDTELFAYTPKAGSETLYFPMEFPQPDAVQVWELYDKPFHVQTWEWMKWASIPKHMQRLAVTLLRDSPDEYLDLFDQWMRAVGGVRLGE